MPKSMQSQGRHVMWYSTAVIWYGIKRKPQTACSELKLHVKGVMQKQLLVLKIWTRPEEDKLLK